MMERKGSELLEGRYGVGWERGEKGRETGRRRIMRGRNDR